jgi:hypothetical protein
MTEKEEKGFFCYVEDNKDSIKHNHLCDLIKKAAEQWLDLDSSKKSKYKDKAEACKGRMKLSYLTESCVRAADRDIAQQQTSAAIQDMLDRKVSSKSSYCMINQAQANEKTRKNFLFVLDEETLRQEKNAYKSDSAKGHKAITPYVDMLLSRADKSLKDGKVYSVMDKTRSPKSGAVVVGKDKNGKDILVAGKGTEDKHNYYSMRPYYWPMDMVPEKERGEYTAKTLPLDISAGFLHLDGHRVPGSVISG